MIAADFPFESLLRELAPQALGALVRRFGDFAAAEDAVQEALLAAALQWPEEGLPRNPRGWLIQVGARRLVDSLRAGVARQRRETLATEAAPLEVQVVVPSAPEAGLGEDDDTLLLLFMCCHPALTRPSSIALTLRAVGGLKTAEIANAFLVPEATMAQRISRAKRSIKDSGIPFAEPSPSERAERLGAVLQVLYLIFSEGYASSIGPELQRADLAAEAIRLTRAVHQQAPGDPEVAGLLALMLLTDARRLARSGPGGEIIPLDHQDRSRWDRSAIAEGTAILTAAIARGAIGPYQLQAAIAALHDQAPSHQETDWPQILALYDLLQRMTDNPMVALSQTIAAAMVHGPAHGLARLDTLSQDPRIAGHYRLDAVRGHFHEMAGDSAKAIPHFRAAASRTTSLPERDFLLAQAARLEARPASV